MNDTPPTSRDLYLRLLGHVKPYWVKFALAVLAMVVLAASQATFAALLKPLLDDGFIAQDPDTLFYLPWAIFGIAIVRAFSSFLASFGMSWIANRVVYDLRQLLFARVLTLPTPFFDDMPTGKLLSKLTFDVNQVAQTSSAAITILVRESLTIVGLLAWLLYLNWQLSVISFVLIPVTALLATLIGRRVRFNSRRLQNEMGEMTHVIEEAIRGQKIVRIYNGSTAETNRFEDTSRLVLRLMTKVKAAGAMNVAASELLGATALAVIVFVGVRLAVAEQLTTGGFVSFITAMGLLFAPIKKLTSVSVTVQTGLAAAESVFAVLDARPENETGDRELASARGALSFRGVGFGYAGEDAAVLRDVSFEVAAGQTVAIVGPSGSGKTTLLNLLPRFYQHQHGQILLDGIDITELRLHSLRSHIASVSQDVVLFNDSIAANIAYGSPNPERAQIEEAARRAHALEFIEAMPEGLDTLVGENGVKLSGGQRQRIAIARALFKNAPILILDEATSALDIEAEKHVQQALEDLERDRTTLVVAHRLSTVEKADQILVMDGGGIVERGTHQELLTQGGLYERLYRNQFRDDQRKPGE